MMKRILFIANYRKNVGGIAVQMDILKENLLLEGFRVDIFSTKGNPIRRVGLFFALLAQAREYDVLHVHGCSHWGMLPVVYGIIAGRLWNKRVIVTYHGGGAGDYLLRHASFARRWLNRADEVIVLSGYLQDIFNNYRIRNRVIPNILRVQTNIPPERTQIRPNFISVRSLEPLYNISCIIKAFAIVKTAIPAARLTIMGKGSQRESLETLVRELQLADVEFTGLVPNTDVPQYLRESDVFLSATGADNMPVSLLEAYRAGLLVISSEVGGIPYILKDGETGLLFSWNDEKQLAEKMQWVVNHQQESLRMIANAKEYVEQYSWKNIKEKLIRIYNNEQ